ncbi:MAG TPA: hypothetical protein VFK73_04825, partial [Paludibacter sp.]|nr:hypothetical protein [Paludibacter sp.]
QMYEELVLEIIDNGVGFDENQKTKHDSYGLIGMKERAFLLDSKLSIMSELHKGTHLKMEIPYKIKNEEKIKL